MKKIAIGLAAGALLLAGCGSSSEGEAGPAVPPADPAVAEWAQIASDHTRKIDAVCMDKIAASTCIRQRNVVINGLEAEVLRQPAGPYRADLLKDLGLYVEIADRYEGKCSGSKTKSDASCAYMGNLLDSYAEAILDPLQQMVDRSAS